MPDFLRVITLLSALCVSGCATQEPVKIPYPVPVPEACLVECSYSGPEAIVTNGDLLEAFRGRLDQVACYQSRIACVRDAGR